MSTDEKPKVVLKLEVVFPDLEGGPAKKFCVNRTLKARWTGNPQATTQAVLEEIKNYKGSFVGDMMVSLASLVANERAMNLPENKRSLDVDRWLSSIVEKLIYSSINEGVHEDLTDVFEIPEWDGLSRKIDEVTSSEVEKADADRVMLLIGPKVKHALLLLAKSMRNKFRSS